MRGRGERRDEESIYLLFIYTCGISNQIKSSLPPSSTDRRTSPFEWILKDKVVLETKDADLEKSSGKHMAMVLFEG